MFKTTIAAMMLASSATAGDLLEEEYFYVVGSIKSEISTVGAAWAGKRVFRETLAQLTTEWRAKCGEDANVWHTNLMYADSDDEKWTPGYWFVYLAMAQTETNLRADIPKSPCAAEGYIKLGRMFSPGVLIYCYGEPDLENPEQYEQTCN